MYLLIRIYKDGSRWATVGTKKRIEYLHSYCNGVYYKDRIIKL